MSRSPAPTTLAFALKPAPSARTVRAREHRPRAHRRDPAAVVAACVKSVVIWGVSSSDTRGCAVWRSSEVLARRPWGMRGVGLAFSGWAVRSEGIEPEDLRSPLATTPRPHARSAQRRLDQPHKDRNGNDKTTADDHHSEDEIHHTPHFFVLNGLGRCPCVATRNLKQENDRCVI